MAGFLLPAEGGRGMLMERWIFAGDGEKSGSGGRGSESSGGGGSII